MSAANLYSIFSNQNRPGLRFACKSAFCVSLTIAFLSGPCHAVTALEPLPKGLILNLDFQQVEEGLIPNNSPYPLFVPLAGLGIETFNHRNMLTVQQGQGFDIPHSSLLDPDGSEWIATVRAFPLTDGLILSQANGEHGYAIYMIDGTIRATVRTSHSALTLQENEDRGVTSFKRRWVTVELRIKQDMAILSLNRRRVAMLRLSTPLAGEDMQIRLGTHRALPSVLKNLPGARADGFTGAISSLKIFRQ